MSQLTEFRTFPLLRHGQFFLELAVLDSGLVDCFVVLYAY
jgi:hypothetical protein